MEKRPKSPNILSDKERQRVVKEINQAADEFNIQLVFAPLQVRQNYIAILSTASVLQQGELPDAEQEHLRRILAAQSWSLDKIHDGVSGLKEFRETVTELASKELEEWLGLDRQDINNQPVWRYTVSDASKVDRYVSRILKEEE